MMGKNQMLEYEVKIKKLREALDQVDEEIITILLKRFDLTHEVGLIKYDFDMPILDQNREKALLEKIEAHVLNKVEHKNLDEIEKLQKAIKEIFEAILLQSKALQSRIEIKL